MRIKALLISIGLFISFAVLNLRAAGTVNTNWNVVVLDRLLASASPGQKLIQVGDMRISASYLRGWRNKLAGGPQANLAFQGTFNAWPGGNVYYTFSNNVSPIKQKAFQDGMAEWEMFANLHFIPRTTQTNYITVYEDTSIGGGESAVGMVGGQQFLQIGPLAWNHATICHELGHSLGLVHEHQRSDRDAYVTILTNNISAGEEGNFVILTDSQNKTSYDFLSIMHYSRNSFSIDSSLDTIEPKPGYSQYIDKMGQQFDPVLSASDRAGVASVYGPGPVLTSMVTNTQDTGPGSLRAAMYYAADHPGTVIQFDIPASDPGYSNNVFNILPSDSLPGLWTDTALDGNTEPVQSNTAGPQVLINGEITRELGIYADGLRFRGTNNVAHSLVINNFSGDGVRFTGSNTVGNVISGCYLGIDPTGTIAITNGYVPVEITGGAISNIVGGTTAADRNVISGSGYQGIAIDGTGTRYNVVEGNYIGLTADGLAPLPNTWEGVQIFGGAESNLVGGFTVSARNVISGNGFQGVAVSDNGTIGNMVAENYIGLSPTGASAISNGWSGVDIFGGSGTVVGPGNVISGNGNYGVVISASGTAHNLVQGNYIGLNAMGTAAVPNNWAGVGIFNGAQSNLVGGVSSEARNVISGNGDQGVVIGNSDVSENIVAGNYIGVNAFGSAAVGNGWAGVNLFGGTSGNVIGGNFPGAGNLISGNGAQGVLLQDPGTSANEVQGNLIGLNAAGNVAISNSWSGIEIYNGPSGNLIGGYGMARNFISGNGNYGISLNARSSGNFIQGNTIGLDDANGSIIPNTWSSIALYGGAVSNLIGGVTAGAANLISGSAYDSIQLFDATTTNNTIRGNSLFNLQSSGIALYNQANQNIAAPTLGSVVVTTNTSVSGSYTGVAGEVYQLDFYAEVALPGPPESGTYLGSISFTGTGGVAPFNAQLGTHLPVGTAVTATVTDAAGNTSQLCPGVSSFLFSTPNDGIPDAWRARYFGGSGTSTNSQSAASADPDHDGMSNYQEFLAGTDPTDAASVLKLTAYDPEISTNVVSLSSPYGTVYRVLSRDSLDAGHWDILADQVIGNGTNLWFYDPAAPAEARRFYRAEVLW